jgi:hypothetical protein
MNQPTNQEKEQIIKAMKDLDVKECRCKAIEKKVNLAGIRKLSEIRGISLYKARKIYEDSMEPFHTCCHACCSCHIERFSENVFY